MPRRYSEAEFEAMGDALRIELDPIITERRAISDADIWKAQKQIYYRSHRYGEGPARPITSRHPKIVEELAERICER